MQPLMLLSLLVATLFETGDPPNTAEAIQRRAVEERLKIKSGQLHVRNLFVGHEADAVDLQVAFDYNGRRYLRIDTLMPSWNVTYSGTPTKVVSNGGRSLHKLIARDDKWFYYNPDVYDLPSKHKPGGSINPPGRDEYQRLLAIDPLVLGMTPETLVLLGHINVVDAMVGKTGATTTKLEKETIDGDETWKISSEFPDGLKSRVWISAKKSYGVVRLALESGIRPSSSVSEIQLNHFPEADIWFPERVITKRFMNGKLHSEEQMIIDEASFGQKIDEQLFELAGLELPPETLVTDSTAPEAERQKIWDGASLVFVKRPEPNFPRRLEAAKRSRWLLVAINLAGIALLLFVLYWRRRHRAA